MSQPQIIESSIKSQYPSSQPFNVEQPQSKDIYLQQQFSKEKHRNQNNFRNSKNIKSQQDTLDSLKNQEYQQNIDNKQSQIQQRFISSQSIDSSIKKVNCRLSSSDQKKVYKNDQKRNNINNCMLFDTKPFDQISIFQKSSVRQSQQQSRGNKITEKYQNSIQNNVKNNYNINNDKDIQNNENNNNNKDDNNNDILQSQSIKNQVLLELQPFDNIPLKVGMHHDLKQGSEQSTQKKNEINSNSDYLHKEEIFKIQQAIQNLQNSEKLFEFFKEWKVNDPSLISITDLLQLPTTKLKKYKNGAYFGGIINNQRCGVGIMIYREGKIYEGQWLNDVKLGKGYELYPNGNSYKGGFVNGNLEGVGTYLWSNGEVYEGQWVQSKKHGSGMWKSLKKDSYIGEWNQGIPNGYGVHTWINGDRYEGQFKSSLKHGDGQEKFSNGDCFKGTYANGKPEGKGEYLWSDGSSFIGEFKNGLRHGKGIWKKRNRENKGEDYYEGQYINDKKSGYGFYVWASGNSYRGEFFNDQRQGMGIMKFADGTIYQGEWENDKQNGKGQLIMPNQEVKKGIFLDNNLIAPEQRQKQSLNFQESQQKYQDTLMNMRNISLGRSKSAAKTVQDTSNILIDNNNNENGGIVSDFFNGDQSNKLFCQLSDLVKIRMKQPKKMLQNYETIEEEDEELKKMKKPAIGASPSQLMTIIPSSQRGRLPSVGQLKLLRSTSRSKSNMTSKLSDIRDQIIKREVQVFSKGRPKRLMVKQKSQSEYNVQKTKYKTNKSLSPPHAIYREQKVKLKEDSVKNSYLTLSHIINQSYSKNNSNNNTAFRENRQFHMNMLNNTTDENNLNKRVNTLEENSQDQINCNNKQYQQLFMNSDSINIKTRSIDKSNQQQFQNKMFTTPVKVNSIKQMSNSTLCERSLICNTNHNIFDTE